MKALRGSYTVTTDKDLQPTVTFWPDGRVLTGDEAKKFLRRGDRALKVAGLLFLPVSLVFAAVAGIHNLTGRILSWFFGEGFRD